MDWNSKGGFGKVTEYSFLPSCKYWTAILWTVNSQYNAFYDRTDNAVKNRFSTLRKKRGKNDIDSNSKRNISYQDYNTDAMSESAMPVKKTRYRAL